ncbi:hypothetical protein [Microlunatus parietis]|uniref:YD repeat-containing protein n=1 Tax=Microlunatus parietis TaxID=682979 RepID=A0A7Y9LFW1_9ACTN|nr:hypothetical protein [Microlunatus parietis]
MLVLVAGLVIMFGAIPAATSSAAEVSYAGIRIVRASPGTPSVPEVTLPEGYAFVAGEKFHVASRAEYYTFIQGPRSEAGITVTVRWPGIRIADIVWRDNHLSFDRPDRDTVTFTVPVTAATTNAEQPTIQVWSSIPTVPGVQWRIEHNDPDRVAGPWTTVAWPAGQVTSVISYLVASEAVLKDSGLAATAATKGHTWYLMGFETNNTLHPDNPPHWHLSYYAGPNTSARAYLPHFWFDKLGKNYYNGMDVSGQGRLRYYVGDPAPMYDFAGNLVATTVIREDGGLDIINPEGRTYAIKPGRDATFLNEINVTRDDKPWLTIRTSDDVKRGLMIFTITDRQRPGQSRSTVYEYDRLTGVLKP